MATKMLFGSVRAQLVGTLVAAVGGIALTACHSSCCDPCKGGPPVYRKPCCAQEGGGGGYAPMGPSMGQPMPPPPPPPGNMPPRPGGGQMSCGAGKCG